MLNHRSTENRDVEFAMYRPKLVKQHL